MQNTFLQKVILTVIAGFLAASLIEFYKNFIQGADDALNAGYRNRTELGTKK